jgi:carbon-monoxide dehydrogenase small subunit
MNEMTIEFKLNGRRHRDVVASNSLLIDYLRDNRHLKGAKIGCGRGVCGACTVLMEDTPVAACSIFTFQIDGTCITTVEGLGNNGRLDPVQQAFIDHSAFQCGYCTSGMILLTKALLARDANPDRASIVEWLSSNVCRCTGYAQIIAAVEDAARRMREVRR